MSESILPNYTFLPWVRKGISNQINETENKGDGTGSLERATVDVKLKVTGNIDPTVNIAKSINLIGPGDIVGVHPTSIVKTEPADWITNFEPNFLASIDFYDEDFVWRYSPAVANANHQLRPWLFLVVLKEDEFNLEEAAQGKLSTIEIPDGADANFLPNYEELATWAHVHVNNSLDPDEEDILSNEISRLNNIIETNPDSAISRIISPRKLEENTKYYAFLIPTYETGRLAGLGIDPSIIATVPSQNASWGSPHVDIPEPNKWPVYYNWKFSTGIGGDFEQLVRLLKPRALDSQVGRRPMDIQNPGFGLNYIFDTDEGGVPKTKVTLSLEGALKIPESEGEAYPYPENEGLYFRKKLQDLVNLEEDLKLDGSLSDSENYFGELGVEIGDASVDDDPIIAPPLYGRWHILENRANINDTQGVGDTTNWFNELNLDPRNRAVASVGTSVIQEKQDVFLDQAWEQFGDVIEANKKVLWAQLAVETSNSLYKKHVKSQPDEKALALTGKMKRRIRNIDSGKTFYQEEKEARLPLAVEDKSFRRIARPAGSFMKKLDPEQKINTAFPGQELIYRLDNDIATAAISKSAPDLAQTTLVSTLDLGINNTIPNSPAFRLGSIGVDPSNVGGTETGNFKIALAPFTTYFDATNWITPDPKLPFDITKATTIKEEIKPKKTILNRFYKTVIFDEPVVTPERIVPAMAHPVFKQPMYENIRDLSTELLIPNLNLVPANTISLLETNQKFIESYMVGLNHEMGRELLWREYPTDQRGSYFQQFWNVSDSINTEGLTAPEFEENRYDISKIHTWGKTTNLGTHNIGEVLAKPVLLIRGELLQKYPNVVIYAIQAEWQIEDGEPAYHLPRRPKTDTESYPIFNAKIEPDITFFGFDLTISEARGADPTEIIAAIEDGEVIEDDNPGYFFVIKERPGEVRFGLDLAPEEALDFDSWNDLHWGRLSSTNSIGLADLLDPSPAGPINWNADMNAAEMASVLYQNPVMICVHAREMLQEAE